MCVISFTQSRTCFSFRTYTPVKPTEVDALSTRSLEIHVPRYRTPLRQRVWEDYSNRHAPIRWRVWAFRALRAESGHEA